MEGVETHEAHLRAPRFHRSDLSRCWRQRILAVSFTVRTAVHTSPVQFSQPNGAEWVKGLPRRAQIYVSLLTATAVTVLVLLVTDYPVPIAATIGFGVLCFLAEQFPVSLGLNAEYSGGFVITMATLVSLGPAAAAIAGAFGGISLRK